MDYMMTAAKAVADIGARLKEEYLFNHYWMGRRQIERGQRADGGPFAYVLEPDASHDPTTVVEFMELMAQSGIEFVQADGSFQAGGRTFAAGSYVIPPQAFRPYVVDLMEPKEFPDRRQFPGGPPIPPYDMTGYELRYQMGLEVANIAEPFEMPAGVWGEVDRDIGTVEGDGTGAGYVLDARSNWAYRALRDYVGNGGDLQRLSEAPSGISDSGVDAGEYWLQRLSAGEATDLADRHGVTLTLLDEAPPSEALLPTRLPRVAIYRSWDAPMPEGWTRWALDQYGLAWENVWDDDVRSGALSDFDVLVIPDQSEDGIRDGNEPGTMPEPYVGGLGDEGTAAVRAFVQEGGWVVAFDEAVDYAISTFDLPFRNTVRGVSTQEFFLPGSIIRLELDPSHPINWGMPDEAMTLFARSQILERTDGGATPRVTTPICYAAEDYLVSGWTLGGDAYLAGRTAAATAAVGEGQVVLFGFTPHFRGQPRNTFKLLFNSLVGASTDGLEMGEGGLSCR